MPEASATIDPNIPFLVCVVVRFLSDMLPTFAGHSLWNIKCNIIESVTKSIEHAEGGGNIILFSSPVSHCKKGREVILM